MVGGGLLCALIHADSGAEYPASLCFCIFWVFLQFAYAMLSVPLTSAIQRTGARQVPPSHRTLAWHRCDAQPSAWRVHGCAGVMFNSFAPFGLHRHYYLRCPVFATVLILPKGLLALSSRTSF